MPAGKNSSLAVLREVSSKDAGRGAHHFPVLLCIDHGNAVDLVRGRKKKLSFIPSG